MRKKRAMFKENKPEDEVLDYQVQDVETGRMDGHAKVPSHVVEDMILVINTDSGPRRKRLVKSK